MKQKKKVFKISGKNYDPHNVETETFTLFTSLTGLFI